jgi:type II secretory pathway component PulF
MAQAYNYRARTAANQVVTGVVKAASLDAARRLLVQNGLTPITVTPPAQLSDLLPFLGRVTARDRAFFARQLATMIEAGLTLSQAIRLLIRQTPRGEFRLALESVLVDLQEGFSFSAALAKFPTVFDDIFVNVVRSGEATGKLEEVLSQLAYTLEKDQDLRSRVSSALVYPAFIIVAIFGVGVLMMTRVIPQLADLFQSSGAQLPLATRALIGLSNFFTNYWYLAILMVIGLVVGIRAFLRTDAGKEVFSTLALRIPMFSELTIQVNMARMGRLMGMMLGSSVPLLETLNMLASSFSNIHIKRAIIAAAAEVERGQPLSVPLSKNELFPPLVGQMAAVGEQTGKLDDTMSRMAKYYDTQTDAKVRGLTALIEPMVIILLGVAVAWLLMAILMPIYQLSSLTT